MSVSMEIVYDHGAILVLASTGGARILSPRLAHLEQAVDFVMQVNEVLDA